MKCVICEVKTAKLTLGSRRISVLVSLTAGQSMYYESGSSARNDLCNSAKSSKKPNEGVGGERFQFFNSLFEENQNAY